MVFSFFKKQPNKMPERPAAKPRPPEKPPVVEVPSPAAIEAEAVPLPEPLPDLEFTTSNVGVPATKPVTVTRAEPEPQPEVAVPSLNDLDFTIDDFDAGDFTESSVMAIDIEHDADPLQSCVEQVVVLYANGQDAAARSLLETFVRAYQGSEGKRFWLLLFDLLQLSGDREAFEKLGDEYAQACETSPPTWRADLPASSPVSNGVRPSKIFLQGVLTAEVALPVDELARLVAQKSAVIVDCGKLIGCDDEVAAQLADLLLQARKQRTAVTLMGIDAFIGRLNSRLMVGENVHEAAWRLLLELLQRHGTQEVFEERAVDYAVTFEKSPPSWEAGQLAVTAAGLAESPGDDAHYLSGELKSSRFDDLPVVLEAHDQPILDFSGVRRLDFVSAGQLVNRLTPYKAAGKDIIIRSPNHLIAELMAVVGLNKQARIIVPKS